MAKKKTEQLLGPKHGEICSCNDNDTDRPVRRPCKDRRGRTHTRQGVPFTEVWKPKNRGHRLETIKTRVLKRDKNGTDAIETVQCILCKKKWDRETYFISLF